MALATIMRSPNSWVTSLTYGVSPQPAHAPENSNSGLHELAALNGLLVDLALEFRQRVIRDTPSSFSSADWLASGFMSSALVLGGADLYAVAAAGAIQRGNLHTVQLCRRTSLPVAGLVLKDSGASAACSSVTQEGTDAGVRADHASSCRTGCSCRGSTREP